MNLLEVRHVTLRFGGLTAVNDVSLSIPKGSIFSIIGPNGAGKTSLFNAISGIYEPTEGEVLLGGINVSRKFGSSSLCGILLLGLVAFIAALVATNLESFWEAAITGNYIYQEDFPWRKAAGDGLQVFSDVLTGTGIRFPLFCGVLGVIAGLVVWNRGRRCPEVVAACGISRTFQNIRLFPEMTALENVLVGMDRRLHCGVGSSLFRSPRFWKEKRVTEAKAKELLEFVDLLESAQVPSANLPYGYQRRLEIARGLASEPCLLLLDEPAAGMNPSEAEDLIRLIRKIKQSGVTVMLIEHHMRVVMGISDRISVLDYGNKIAEGTPEEIRNDPKVIAAYLGKTE